MRALRTVFCLVLLGGAVTAAFLPAAAAPAHREAVGDCCKCGPIDGADTSHTQGDCCPCHAE